jgi:hypothetical protein
VTARSRLQAAGCGTGTGISTIRGGCTTAGPAHEASKMHAMTDSMQREEWKPVPGFEGMYSVSNYGRVRSEARKRCCGGKGGQMSWPQKILKPWKTTAGYLSVSLSNITTTKRSVHRLVLLAFRGPPPSDAFEAAHMNGCRQDNRLENLQWATAKENNSHRVIHDTINRGERCGLSKLRAEQVREIRRRAASGERYRSIGKDMGVSRANISLVVRRETWAHLDGGPTNAP